MHTNPFITSVTVSVGALGALAAVIWQVVHGAAVDPLLAGLAGSLMASLVPSPLTSVWSGHRSGGTPVHTPRSPADSEVAASA